MKRSSKRLDASKALSENEKKWGSLLMKPGWVAIPSIILERQQALGLDAVDLNIIMHITRHWWYAEKLPFPGKKAIAECMGVSERTVQRRISKLVSDGLITRIPRYDANQGQKTNSYDLKELILSATDFAKEAIETKRKMKQENAARRRRKGKPQISQEQSKARRRKAGSSS